MERVQDGRTNFDFLHGSWTIHNRRLVKRLQGCTDWETFAASGTCGPVLGGIGNVDDFRAALPDGSRIEGMSLRIFDPLTENWSIYWADDRSCQLQPPVIGRFAGGRGEFTGGDTFEGRPIKVIFHWDDAETGAPRWSQSFSDDGGQTWELNWEMLFTRLESGS